MPSRRVLRQRQAIARLQVEAAEAELEMVRQQGWDPWLVRAAEIVVDTWWEQFERPGRRIGIMHEGEL